MLLLMKKLSWSLIQSLKTKARTPAVSSRKKMIPRNTENCEGGTFAAVRTSKTESQI